MNPLEQFSPVPLFIFSINGIFFNLTTISIMFFFSFFAVKFFVNGMQHNPVLSYNVSKKEISLRELNALVFNKISKTNSNTNKNVFQVNVNPAFENQIFNSNVVNSFIPFFPNSLRYVVELFYMTIVQTVNDNIGGSNKNSVKFFPVVFTVFLFILSANLLGLIPYSSTITGYLIITFALAVIVLVGVWFHAFRVNGIRFFGSFIPSGCPTWLWPLIIPIELISNIFRLISLPVRLFANMMAGHLLLGVLAGFGFLILTFQSVWLSNVFIFPTLVIYVLVFLEIAVAFIQAIVFSILMCVYLDEAINMH